MVKAYVAVEYSLKIYQENENKFKHDSIGKEIKNYRAAFNLQTSMIMLQLVTRITCHLVFNVKIELFPGKLDMCLEGISPILLSL